MEEFDTEPGKHFEKLTVQLAELAEVLIAQCLKVNFVEVV